MIRWAAGESQSDADRKPAEKSWQIGSDATERPTATTTFQPDPSLLEAKNKHQRDKIAGQPEILPWATQRRVNPKNPGVPDRRPPHLRIFPLSAEKIRGEEGKGRSPGFSRN
jgi:hypothetical protein